MRRASWACGMLCLLAGAEQLAGQDVIYLKTGESLACRLDALTDNIVSFTLLSKAGTAGGSARQTIPADLVDRIEFDFAAGEAEFFEKRNEATAGKLREWWDFTFAHLHRPRSRAAAYGIALANAMIREQPGSGPDRALPILDRVIDRAWSPEDIAQAKHGRLRALMAKGDLETATSEAQVLARETENPELLIEVNYLLARADMEKLKALEAEHPRWEEDDEVRPERNELFHRTMDRFLGPHLFHATREEVAARGLFAAAELYAYAGEILPARNRWNDLIKLYPDSTFAAQAAARLESLPSSTEPTDEPP